MSILKSFNKDKLEVTVFSSRAEMGKTAGNAAAEKLRALLAEKAELNVMFAAAPSQNEFLAELISAPGIDWTRINAFHMDEYVALAPDAPQGFGNFLRARVFSKAPFKSVSYLDGNNSDIDAECSRYSALLRGHPLDVCLMGVGENGHIAFNDPPVADFNDTELVKVVELERRCRVQQVNDGCFSKLDEVPTHALTVTVPGLMSAKTLFCVVPAPTKAEAIRAMLTGGISTACPASILRTHDDAKLYLDGDSGAYIL